MDPESGKGKIPEETKGTLIGGAHLGVTGLWILFAFLFWIIALAGISAAQNKCSGQPTSLPYQAPGQSTTTPLYQGPAFNVLSNLPALGCSKVFRFMWWSLWLEFTVLVLVTLVVATNVLDNARVMAVGFLAVATVLLMISADKFLNIDDLTSGSFRKGSRVAFAGFIMSAAFNFFTMYMVGIDITP